MNDPNGHLTRHEFHSWQTEHQKYLESQFNKLCTNINEIKSTRNADWKLHQADHKENKVEIENLFKTCKEECDDTFNCNVTSVNKNFKWVWIGVGALFVILLVSHPDAVLSVGKAVTGLFK